VKQLYEQHAAEDRCIIFSETKSDCDALAHSLGNTAQAIHGDVTQGKR
jgi:superfamily II DNA/RNA helicase